MSIGCKKKLRIGFVVNTFDIEYSLQILPGITDFCTKHNATHIIFYARNKFSLDNDFEYQYYEITQFINSNTLDGLIFLSASQCAFLKTKELEKYLKSLSPLPIVSIGIKFKDIISIESKSEDAFGMLLQHLIDKHGCKRIMIMSHHKVAPDIKLRELKYKEIIEKNNLVYDKSLIKRINWDFREIAHSLKKYKSKSDLDFDAICFMNDKLGVGCLEFFASIGVNVPQDVIVTSFDDTPISLLANPQLSTVSQNLYRQGYEAASLIFNVINGNPVEKYKLVHSEPIYRESCGCSSFDDLSFFETNETSRFEFLNKSIKCKQNWLSLKYLKEKEELFSFQQFIHTVRTTESTESFCKCIKKTLQAFGINFSAFCLFKEPVRNIPGKKTKLPNLVKLFMGYDTETSWFDYSGTEEFNPKENLLPPNLDFNLSSEVIVLTLFNSNLLYGYVCFTLGDVEIELYPLIFSVIATELSSILELEQTKTQANLLKQTNDSLELLSKTDELTGLLNRRGLMHFGNKTLNLLAEMNRKALVIFGDMDGLKKINDDYGHDSGDLAIKGEAEILKTVFRTGDILARLGGDEFVVIANDMEMSAFEKTKSKVYKLAEEWNQNHNYPWKLSISIGAVEFNAANNKLDTLLIQADNAQYQEKKRKKCCRES